MKKEMKLYNVLFPVWMLMMFPVTWLVVLPGNFIIDSIVLLICMSILKLEKGFYKSNILKIFGIGIFSDVIGSMFLFLMMFVFELGRMGDEIYLTLPACIISATCIYVFNYFITFRNCDRNLRIKLALTFAILTAPYTFMIPSKWIY